MLFSFRPLPAIADGGTSALIAARFGVAYDELKAELNGYSGPGSKVNFWVADVTPSRQGPDGLAVNLERLILGQAGDATVEMLCSGEGVIDRLLFVGAKPSLDTWELEGEGRISRMKALEFYIRTLQSAHLSHYAHVVEPNDVAPFLLPDGSGAPISDALIRSELFGLSTYYREARGYLKASTRDLASARERARAESRTQNFAEGVDGKCGLRAQFTSFVGYMREKEEHLVDAPRLRTGIDPNLQLLRDLSAVFQLGKRDVNRAYDALCKTSLMNDRDNLAGAIVGGAYALRDALDDGLASLHAELRNVAWSETEVARAKVVRPLDAALRLRRYELLRDMSRCIGSGAISYLKREATAHTSAERAKATVGGLLIIDDLLWERIRAGEQAKMQDFDRLKSLLDLADWGDRCFVASARGILPGRSAPNGANAVPLAGGGAVAARLEDFRMILMEVDSKTDYLGPSAVQRVVRHLSDVAEVPSPVIVFTRTESSGHIQQSLNLGAVAYVLKERLYQLPFQMRRALEGVLAPRASTSHASSFRGLRALRPEALVKLKRHADRYLVTGRQHWPAAVDAGGATAPPRVLFDYREERWVRELPKADLHCHLGTCISYPAVKAMAMNTAGYALKPTRFEAHNEGIRAVVRRIALAVALSEHLNAVAAGRLHPLVCLALAASAVTNGKLKELHAFGLGDEIVKSFTDESEKLQIFEVASLLVAMLPATSDPAEVSESLPPDRYLTELSASVQASHRNLVGGEFGDSLTAIDLAAERVSDQIGRIARAWKGADAAGEISPLGKTLSTRARWRKIASGYLKRCGKAKKVLSDQLEEARAWLRNPAARERGWDGVRRDRLAHSLAVAVDKLNVGDHIAEAETGKRAGSIASVLKALTLPAVGSKGTGSQISLEEYVMLPERQGPGSAGSGRGLQRYLWGADFLGAEHLQYPENLLIATFALTLDNARDNVIYSEVRCETPGYCLAGMTARGATDLLCLGFDLASIFINAGGASPKTEPSLPLVRSNILLAAKRHKKKAAAREVVSLLESYLRQGEEDLGVYGAHAPAWWCQTRVVGFDISGNEAENPDWLTETLEPLKLLSSPITIHAGEAATAKSIWNAVYRQHARRIGHGLRLREDDRLLDYCVSEGICMEMCPNSNVFTNAFYPVPSIGSKSAFRPPIYPDATSNPRNTYPLLAYMRQGLEVSVATDNRYIHNRGYRDLTSEYLTAARLSNGLTRWEILQLVKAGFKNAFLKKNEIEVLVTAMEERVYRMVSRGWF
ncbi:hypothetical protein OVA11_19655 [Caulobacter sp. SL161]|uniref:hypothetical protein n=1 Tax=Caulobacter sp. SL161 TaxID=2995156 RepID=UPI002274B5D2|nr:hypothetical protein [Caulobacter sp. SL161]MCY1649191.1 hypothetical protein [Caulobacter sp. SL161]